MPKYPREKGKPINLPVYGDAGHNIGIYHAVGVLVINWSSDESVFLALLQALLGGDSGSARVVWFSHHNTATRLEVISRLARENLRDTALVADISAILADFGGCSKIRNFFCHAIYESDDSGKLWRVHGATLSEEGAPIRIDTRNLDRANLNIIVETARNLADMNEPIWRLVVRVEDALRVPLAKQQTSRFRSQTPKGDLAGRGNDQPRE